MTGPSASQVADNAASPVASAPGKLMLAGEYAVLDGSVAILIAVNRRAVARVTAAPVAGGPFLEAVRQRIADARGENSAAAVAAARSAADSSTFSTGAHKLGLGSSAAVTVAATAAALACESADFDLNLAEVHTLAHLAHGDAQQPRGARGSGADIATSVHGGAVAVRPPAPSAAAEAPSGPLATTPLTLPNNLTLLAVWTGRSAATAPLVAAVTAFRAANPKRYDRLTAPIADIAEQLASGWLPATSRPLDAAETVDAFARAGRAVAALGTAAGVSLWIEAHSALAEVARVHRAAVKPSGAGGGDLAVIAVPSGHAQALRTALQARGMPALDLAIETRGVRIENAPSGRIHA